MSSTIQYGKLCYHSNERKINVQITSFKTQLIVVIQICYIFIFKNREEKI